MPFVPTVLPKPYAYKQAPNLPGSDRLFFEREVRTLGEKVNEMAAAIKEIQDYLIANP